MTPEERDGSPGLDLSLAQESDLELWEEIAPDDRYSLVDLVNRVLDRGVVITGDVTLSVAGVELVYLSLSALLTSVSTARRVMGVRQGGAEGEERSGDGA